VHDQEAISMKGLTIAASVVVILLVSAIGLVIINADDAATASQTETAQSRITQPETTTTQPQTEITEPEAEAKEPEADVPLPEFMEERLQDLVERGFITQEQLEELEEQFREHRPWNGELPDDFDHEQFRERFREHRPWNGEVPFGPHGFRFFWGDEDLDGLFGVTPEELMDELTEGTPPIDIIEDPDAFLDSFVGPIEERLSRAVEEGRLTQAEADELIAEARSHAEAFINGEAFEGFRRFGEFGPRNRFGADAEPAGHSA
jgi:hypothetical protein